MEEYPRETLYEIVLSLQHYITINGRDVKLLDHPGLLKMCNTLDNKIKKLTKDGVIHECQQSKPISVEEENMMWQTGLLGDDTPEKLVNILLYLISLYFALCACDKHKALKVGSFGQFKIKVDYKTNLHYLEYMEHQSKSYQGGLKSLYDKPKVVQAFENRD